MRLTQLSPFVLTLSLLALPVPATAQKGADCAATEQATNLVNADFCQATLYQTTITAQQ